MLTSVMSMTFKLCLPGSHSWYVKDEAHLHRHHASPPEKLNKSFYIHPFATWIILNIYHFGLKNNPVSLKYSELHFIWSRGITLNITIVMPRVWVQVLLEIWKFSILMTSFELLMSSFLSLKVNSCTSFLNFFLSSAHLLLKMTMAMRKWYGGP